MTTPNQVKRSPFILLLLLLLALTAHGQRSHVRTARIDGARTFQTFDGIGVNANTRSWNGRELEPALNLLLDSMHATIWRVLVESVENWEDVNDNKDPFIFNWKYYNKLYETPKFRKAWDMIKYLNEHGVTDKLMINFMGFAPQWMGVKVIEPRYEDEYVEMIVSFFHYALKTKHLKFGLIAPTNESEHHCCKEGPHLNGVQHARILRKLIDRMEALNIMGDIRLVAPDNANTEIAIKEYIPEIMKDPVIMSHVAHIGVHSYGGYFKGFTDYIAQSPYPKASHWVTEWNAWCQGCDEGILGEYNYAFASQSVNYLLDLLQHGARAAIAWEGYDSYYEHHAPSPFSYWGMLSYDKATGSYTPRENFYAIQQVSRFVKPASKRIFTTDLGDSMRTVAFYDSASMQLAFIGVNQTDDVVNFDGILSGLPAYSKLELYITDEMHKVSKIADVPVYGKYFSVQIPRKSIFTMVGLKSYQRSAQVSRPEPADWYTGDVHVHRNCGDKRILPTTELPAMMKDNDVDVVSLLADMGNGEVLDSKVDLPKVTGNLTSESQPSRLIQWDAEWHYDATYSNFDHQALGGHLVLLGLREARQMRVESPYQVLEWARKQGAVTGFCHFQYLNDTLQNELNCCLPIDYPVEAALGSFDFISEDVFGVGSPGEGWFNSEAAMAAYYKLLNCGFRLGLTAGTDYPCNDFEPLGTLLTYVQVSDQPLTYQAWVNGIKEGRTVVSRKGHAEFLDMKIDNKYGPGDELKVKSSALINARIAWTAIDETPGIIELVKNGKVVATHRGSVKPGTPVIFQTQIPFDASGWVCARRMSEKGHVTHTAAFYVTVDDKPVRASAEDAGFFINWIDTILRNIAPGNKWSKYFKTEPENIRQRYERAKTIYENIAREASEK